MCGSLSSRLWRARGTCRSPCRHRARRGPCGVFRHEGPSTYRRGMAKLLQSGRAPEPLHLRGRLFQDRQAQQPGSSCVYQLRAGCHVEVGFLMRADMGTDRPESDVTLPQTSLLPNSVCTENCKQALNRSPQGATATSVEFTVDPTYTTLPTWYLDACIPGQVPRNGGGTWRSYTI